jgi:hypothetical protein
MISRIQPLVRIYSAKSIRLQNPEIPEFPILTATKIKLQSYPEIAPGILAPGIHTVRSPERRSLAETIAKNYFTTSVKMTSDNGDPPVDATVASSAEIDPSIKPKAQDYIQSLPSVEELKEKHGIDALIFDCDGTLIHSMEFYWKGWVQVCKKWELEFSETRFYELAGVPVLEIIRKITNMRRLFQRNTMQRLFL